MDSKGFLPRQNVNPKVEIIRQKKEILKDIGSKHHSTIKY
jgi:hypothetical protein